MLTDLSVQVSSQVPPQQSKKKVDDEVPTLKSHSTLPSRYLRLIESIETPL